MDLLLNKKHDFIITDWLSPDENYIIFLDELYDIKNKKKLGDIWENFELFKFFIRYSTTVSNISESIKKSIYNDLNSNLLSESFSKEISQNKEIIRDFINETWVSDFADWAGDQADSAILGLKDFYKSSVEGTKKIAKTISKGEWKQVFSLIQKGIIYFAKKLKNALYHPVGMTLDAILIASGVGKTLQWIPWGIVVGLDIYQLITETYEGSLFSHLLETLFDVMGMVIAGPAAKSLKYLFKNVKNVDDVAKVASKNKKVSSFFQKLPNYLNKISPMLEKVIKQLQQKFPKGAEFIKKILPKVDTFVNKIISVFGRLFSKKPLKAGGGTFITTYGFEKLFSSNYDETIEEEDILNMFNEVDSDPLAKFSEMNDL